jgi:plastocyanin
MRRLLAIGLLALLAAGCGGSQRRSAPPDAIVMTSSSFDPASRAVKQGERITFFNQSRGALHIIVNGDHGASRSETGAASFGGSSGHRSPRGEVWTSPAWTTPGTFHVTCTVHPAMNLTVTVTAP